MKTAIIFGGSGLVGSLLINELEKNNDYVSIISFVRNPLGAKSKKLIEVLVDFNNLDSFGKEMKGDDVFICLGTTIKKAGSIEKMEQIDRDLPIRIAELSLNSGVKRIAVVSSIGANTHSRNYYLRIKGEMEDGIKKLDFENIVIARPSMLLGERKEQRIGEIFGKILFKITGFILIGKLRKYRGIQAHSVARAMINILEQDLQEVYYESDELEKLSK